MLKRFLKKFFSKKETKSEIKMEDEDFYYENGFMVMTEVYHLKRGYCCGSKCRHCPFEWRNVENS